MFGKKQKGSNKNKKIGNLKYAMLKISDKNLYNVILKLGVPANTSQVIRWFIITEDSVKAQSLMDKLNSFCSAVNFFTDFSVEFDKMKDGKYYVMIYTSNFHFSIDNVLFFSKSLFEISYENNAKYDFWEIEYNTNESIAHPVI